MDRLSTFLNFYLCGTVVSVSSETRYLEQIFSNDLSDDKDIYRQRQKLYAQANMLCHKFSVCSVPVKI